jgi:ERCC4-type nuclease
MDSLAEKIAQKSRFLAKELKKNNPDSILIYRFVKDISSIQTETQYRVIRHFYSIKKILTQQQQEKFFNIVLERFRDKRVFQRLSQEKQ